MSQSFAFLFPGQGSQSVGMLSAIKEQFPQTVQDVFDEAEQVLKYDLWDVIDNGPEEKLNQTKITQPALLACEYAMWQIVSPSVKSQIRFLAGHSLGEYTALVCAGVLTLSDALQLVELRGDLMQAAVPQGEGAMAAILGLEDSAVTQACAAAELEEVVAPVNFNSSGQIVIAGNTAAVERAIELCKEAGAKRAMKLPVSVPSHCALMKPAADGLAARLKNIEFNEPSIPVINNVDVTQLTDPEGIKDALIRQLFSPVRWTDTMLEIKDHVDSLVECGPGKVLAGLMKRIERSKKVHSACDVNVLKELS